MTGQASTAAAFALGFSWRKRAMLRAFAARPDIRFIAHASQVPAGSVLYLWGSTARPQELAPDVQIVRVEDGFLRSVGLGADLVRPLSWVLDSRGIYYDATCPSDLEHLLQNTVFSADLMARAAALRQRIVGEGLSKYNLSLAQWLRPAGRDRVILVPGQVESDASIRYGTVHVRTNLDLLKAVRQANPDAWVLYKPHPDVLAGLRHAGAGENEAARWCDEVVGRVSIASLLDQVDEVHVMTSLTGFEALLRGRRVVCHGQPFYAGWGLTQDMQPPARRVRRLSLDELVAATLLLYPRYVRWPAGQSCEAEDALQQLLDWREHASPPDVFWRRWLRPLLRHR